jgi:hypothetical protein
VAPIGGAIAAPPAEIPLTDLHRLFRELVDRPQAYQVAAAKTMLAAPTLLKSCVESSIAQFESYSNIDQPVSPRHQDEYADHRRGSLLCRSEGRPGTAN